MDSEIHRFSIQLTDAEYSMLVELAAMHGVTNAVMIRMLIKEKYDELIATRTADGQIIYRQNLVYQTFREKRPHFK